MADPRSRRSLVACTAVLVFAVATNLHQILRLFAWYSLLLARSAVAGSVLRNALQVVLVVLGLTLVRRWGGRGLAREIGVNRGPGRALAVAGLATLPMFLTFAALFPLNHGLTLWKVLAWSLVAPFAEEVLFRGYLFGQLFRRAGWGFWPASLMVAAVFAAGHSYQAITGRLGLAGLLGVLAVTAVGSVFFAWLYVRWGFNLWVAVWMHALMNLSWDLFAVDTTALGGVVANLARAATVLVAVLVTLKWTKPMGGSAPPRRGVSPTLEPPEEPGTDVTAASG